MKAIQLAIVAATLVLSGGSIFWLRYVERPYIASRGEPSGTPVSYDNSLVLAPAYIEYVQDTDEEFRQEAAELKRRIGTASHVNLGFATFLHISFPDVTRSLADIDTIVQRAKANGLVAHISLVSGFFHGWNGLREQAIREDVRNAQWFADGWIAPPADLKDPKTIPQSVWITPSRYAVPLRPAIEKGIRTVAVHLAHHMARFPETLVTVSGDGEVELTYERSFTAGAEKTIEEDDIVYADYSPFMVAEFRDWLRKNYAGDRSPATDENKDGHTFNRDFGTNFSTWSLKYYDHSGPIPFADYYRLTEKLPKSGRDFIPDGFDAPREPKAGNAFGEAWFQFRKDAVAHWVQDFAGWITSSEDPATGFRIPASRYYTHQIPAEFLFGKPDNLRLKTSASVLKTAFVAPIGSSGVTVFNVFNGESHRETASVSLFAELSRSAGQWGVLEYNPSIPPTDDENYYLEGLRRMYIYRPHLIVPFAWTDAPELKQYRIKDSAFERSLRRFVAEVGHSPWSTRRILVLSGGGGN